MRRRARPLRPARVIPLPVTPFHLGPAMIVKAVANRRFSLGTFAMVQIAIDVESISNMLTGRFPVHGTLHTLAGATVVALASTPAGRYGLSWLYPRMRRTLVRWGGYPGWFLESLVPVSWTAAATGALVGGWSHALLDAWMHRDSRPLLPWSTHNDLLWTHPDAFAWIHVICAGVGVVAFAAWATARRRSRDPEY